MGVIRMPTRVKIMGQRFMIGEVDGLQIAAGNAIGDHGDVEHLNVLGVCDSDAQIIAIEKHQGADRKAETYLHENLHAMLSLAGMRGGVGLTSEEDLVKRLSPILLQFLRDNPNVYTFLTGRYTYR